MTIGDTSGSKIEPSSPYYLGPQDKPGDSITPIRLTSENYDEWSHDVRIALKSRRKFVFVNGTINEPKPPCTDDDWETIQSMLVSWLSHTITPEVKALLPKFENAKQLWDAIQERFGVVDGSRIQQIIGGLRDCRQTEGMSITVYYGKLCQLWDDLDKHHPIIDCKCCTNCTSAKQQLERRASERLHSFLLGLLPDPYASLRSVILAQTPLPTVARAFLMLCQEERVRGLSTVTDPQPELASFNVTPTNTFLNKPPSQMTRTERQKLYCSHCKRSGHDRSMCFDLLGYVPDWYYDLKNARGSNSGRGSSNRGRGGGRGSGGSRSRDEGGNTRSDGTQTESSNSVHTKAAAGASADAPPAASASLVNVYGTPSHDHSGKWLIDTGCSHHVTGNFALLSDVQTIPSRIVGLPDGSKIFASLAGRVIVTSTITLHPVLFVPQLTCNLISASQLSDTLNCEIVTNATLCVIQDRATRAEIGRGDRLDGLYYLRTSMAAAHAVDAHPSLLNLWHNRLGHPSEQIIKLLPFLRNKEHSLSKPCEVCHRAKHIRSSFPLSINNSMQAFEIIHCDLWGPYEVPSCSGARYFLTLVDDFSRGVWVYLLNNKTEVPHKFKLFIAMIKRQFSAEIKIVRSDNGTEFHPLKPYFSEQGMVFQSSCVGTPQQNGRVERKHQHILNVARALRFQSGLPIKFWGECVLAAAFVINRTPSRVLQGVTPYERIYQKCPNFDMLRVFGSLCFAHNQKSKGDKFASRSRKCVFMGYPSGQKGWYLYDIERREFLVSRDVKFYEDKFPFIHENYGEHSLGMSDDIFVDWDYDPSDNMTEASPTPETDTPAATLPSQPQSPAPSPDDTPPTQSPVLGRGQRTRVPNSTLRDYVLDFDSDDSSDSSPSQASRLLVSSPSSGTPYPLANYFTSHKFSAPHRSYLAALTTHTEPRNFKTAVQSSEWRKAMADEMKALIDNETWVL
ncbi:uncharacterized protein LOC141641533 [Silene latifolia]|uniref:uncharacterized protein LOC141641533 n=1 Tax=Silene latifolia TaxID=37657 RepID=UPI003D774723